MYNDVRAIFFIKTLAHVIFLLYLCGEFLIEITSIKCQKYI